MSLQPNLTSYIRNISAKHVRTYAAASAAKATPAGVKNDFVPREQPKNANSGGVAITAVDTNRPVSRLAVYIKAGSRHEREDRPGIVHALRMAAGGTTRSASRFGITRNLDTEGSNITCSTGREYIAYTLEARRDKIGVLGKYLAEVSLNQVFKPWEVEEQVDRLRQDLLVRTPEVRTLEALHKVAFRRGLGNGLYTPKFRVGEVTSEELQDFVKRNFIEASVVGVGLSVEETTSFAASLNVAPSARQICPTKFNGGGEYRKNKGGDLAYIAVAIEGASLGDPKQALASALAQRILGTPPRTKRGLPGGRLSALNGDKSSVSAISATYTDGGLLGVFVTATPSAAGEVTRKAIATLRDPKVTEEDVTRAKHILKSDVAQTLDSEDTLAEDLGLQSLFSGKANSFEETSALIDSVTAADVNAVLKKGGGKIALAAYGNLANVPYLDEL